VIYQDFRRLHASDDRLPPDQKHRKKPIMAQKKAASGSTSQALRALSALAVLAGGLAALPAWAQNFPITPAQRSTAQQVARAGVPISELAPNAPDQYTVKRGDTLWAISGMFLKSPWRWPELWGMNIEQVRNPHRIYPGQQLVLEKLDGMALLRLRADGTGGPGTAPTDTIRVSPRIRYDTVADAALPTLQLHLIEPFLAEGMIVDELTLERAPRIVAAQDERVLLTRGDRAYARGATGAPLVEKDANHADEFRVFRNARALRDPVTKSVLGYEAQYLGKAELARSEAVRDVLNESGKLQSAVVPATIDIVVAREEMRVGDRLVPEPPRQLLSYVPRAPERPVEGSIISMYGDAVSNAGQNQVVVISRGSQDGVENGHVLAILRSGAVIIDRTQPGELTRMKLPDERSGLLMVFRTFDKLSYALILEMSGGVQVGDKVVNPR
jgi:hypothetical protein